MSRRSKRSGHRGSLQLRERNSADQRWWSPARDLTVLLPGVVRETFYDLSVDFDVWHPEWKHVCLALGITEADIALAARTYAKIMRCVLARGEDLRNALQTSGFMTHRVNALIGMIIMEKMTARFVGTYGATLHKGEFDPNHADLRECLELLEKFDETVTSSTDRQGDVETKKS